MQLGYIGAESEHVLMYIPRLKIFFYFLADAQGTIRFWSQIYGAFPSSVNKSVFSADDGSLVQFPSVSVSYEYFLRKDWDPNTIVDFNIASGLPEATARAMNGLSGQPRPSFWSVARDRIASFKYLAVTLNASSITVLEIWVIIPNNPTFDMDTESKFGKNLGWYPIKSTYDTGAKGIRCITVFQGCIQT